MSISFNKILFSKPSPVRQLDAMDCGPACLAYISKIYGKKYSLQYLREICYISKRGVTLLGILEAGKAIGFEVFSTKVDLDTIINKVKLYPCIIHWDQNHFVVLNKIVKTRKSKLYFYLMDPRSGFIKLNEKQFRNGWLGNNDKGIVAFFEPKDEFLNISTEEQKKINYKELLSFLQPYKKKFVLLIFLVFASSLITLVFPFFTKELIDNGISQKNLNLISLILLAQLSLFLGSMIINVIRNWLTLYIGTYVSINLISDFITKLVKLPMKNFDNHMIGDLNQRIIDNERIERLITSESITTFFSIFSFLVFFVVLAYFNIITLVIYFALTLIGILWSIYWINKKKILDFYEFQLKSKNQESIFEIFSGIRDIKLFQLENFKLTKWQSVQNELLSLNIKILKIDQIQTFGYQFINQLKNIIVTYFVAILVLKGKMTLGTLLSISYIIGEMNSPIAQLVSFIKKLQEAKLSFTRLSEISTQLPEENNFNKQLNTKSNEGIVIKNLSFSYENIQSSIVLDNINITIPNSKVTAIVGHSGSGKTTLMKILLRFYEPTKGKIYFNGDDILVISPNDLRKHIGTVLQDGFIFSETIERNVVTNSEEADLGKLNNALKIACIFDFVNSLPQKHNTIIGSLGNNLSTGQKQRILIARAIYKNPNYLFLDEATSALDSKTEKIIHNNLIEFYKNKTVLIIAHRLSTVKNADNIIVLDSGKVVESGNHKELIEKKGAYYDLINNQLELS
ncbi:peptidase domain-containing ABC transporter [Flavobacterium croceum]|uniref:ATP-binding cassette subfamily B protein n=3 Tax=Flavobacterium TaxID=237 RepID=A0A2S4N530_9FLAO|nr:peptidase domain-containing ABC transporter [Flavobacterium croceum]POS00760.1 ATP-binding cassette subfamily B protein [Flavobacterium croceum DSM 17960]